MPFTEVTITGHFEGPVPGQTARGTITFQLTAAMQLAGTVVPARPIDITLDGSGNVPTGTRLWATDDIGVGPPNVEYQAIVEIVGAPREVKYFPLSHLSSTFDLSQWSDSVPPRAAAAVLRWRGAWQSPASYQANDLVTTAGGAWIALRVSTNVAPGSDGTAWQLVPSPANVRDAQGVAVPTLRPVFIVDSLGEFDGIVLEVA
jgi:hypothetical protein